MGLTRSALAGALFVITGSLIAGCSSDTTSAAGSAGSAGTAGTGGTAGAGGTAGSGGTGGATDPCAASTGVCLLFTDDFDVKGEILHAAAQRTNIASTDVLVVAADGTAKTYPSKTFDDAHVEIADVPQGEYWLRFTSVPNPDSPASVPAFQSFVSTSLRKIDFGNYLVERPDTVDLTTSAPLHVSGPLAVPWLDLLNDPTFTEVHQDSVVLNSREAGAYGYVYGDPTDASQSNPPAQQASALDWTFDATASMTSAGWRAREISKVAGDAVVLSQSRSSPITDFGEVTPSADPAWKSGSVELLVSSMGGTVDVRAGATGEITGPFSPVTSAGTVNVDFRGAEFLNLAQASVTDSTLAFSVSSSIYLSYEPGVTEVSRSPNPSLLSLFASTTSVPVDATCYPDDVGMCPAAMCPTGCNDATEPSHPIDLKMNLDYTNPYSANTGSLDYSESMSFRVTVTHPVAATSERLRGTLSVSGKLDSDGLPATIDFVKNVKIGGKPTHHESALTGVGSTPTLSWDAPPTGADHYTVTLVDLDDVTGTDGTVSAYRSIARISTLGTSFTVPPGVLISGHVYYAQINAIKAGFDEARPNRQSNFDTSSSIFPTGMFTP